MEEETRARPRFGVRLRGVAIAVGCGVLLAFLVRGAPQSRQESADPPPPQILAAAAVVEIAPKPLFAQPPASPPAPQESEAAPPVEPAPSVAPSALEPIRFREIWAYLMPGEDGRWRDSMPLTDIGLFDFSLDAEGKLQGKPNAKAIERAQKLDVRPHLAVATSGNASLFHLILTPRFGVRDELIAALADLARRNTGCGLQIDFEGARRKDREPLVAFLQALRAALPSETRLSLALPAKTKDTPGPYVYADLASLADRFFIMVYDQHWKGGAPGPVSAQKWHEEVLDCARTHLPLERVVAGLPFYGRVWQREEIARAVQHEGARNLLDAHKSEVKRDPKKSPCFTFKTEVTAECWFEDAESLRAKLESAKQRGFTAIGFWRLGQEDPRVWEMLARE